MKPRTRTLAAAIAAAVFAFGSSAASADPRGDRGERGARHQDDRRGGQHWQRDGGNGHRDAQRSHRARQDRHERQWHDRQDHRRAAPAYRHGPPPHARAGGRGAGPRHDLYVGRYVPTYYRTPHYVVRDWRGHRLGPPPRGYHWVQTGADYVLIAIGTGLIAQAVLGW